MTDLSFLDHETSHFIDDNLDFSDFDKDMDVEENEAFSKIVSEQMASIVSKDVPVENTTEQNDGFQNALLGLIGFVKNGEELFQTAHSISLLDDLKICFTHETDPERKFYTSAKDACHVSAVFHKLVSSASLPFDEESSSYQIGLTKVECDFESMEVFALLCRSNVDDMDMGALKFWKALPLVKKFDCPGMQSIIYSHIEREPTIDSMAEYDALFPNTMWSITALQFLAREIALVNSSEKHVLKSRLSLYETFSKTTLLRIMVHMANVQKGIANEAKKRIQEADLRTEKIQKSLQDIREEARAQIFHARKEAENNVMAAKERAMARFVDAKRVQKIASEKAREIENKAQIAKEASARALEELLRHQEAVKRLSEKAKQMKVQAAQTTALAEEARVEEQKHAQQFALASLTALEIKDSGGGKDDVAFEKAYKNTPLARGSPALKDIRKGESKQEGGEDEDLLVKFYNKPLTINDLVESMSLSPSSYHRRSRNGETEPSTPARKESAMEDVVPLNNTETLAAQTPEVEESEERATFSSFANNSIDITAAFSAAFETDLSTIGSPDEASRGVELPLENGSVEDHVVQDKVPTTLPVAVAQEPEVVSEAPDTATEKPDTAAEKPEAPAPVEGEDDSSTTGDDGSDGDENFSL